MDRKKKNILLGIIFFLIVALFVSLFFGYKEVEKRNEENNLSVYNLESTAFVLVSNANHDLYIENGKIEECPQNDPTSITCVKYKYNADAFSYYEIVNVNPQTSYEIKSYKDSLYKFLDMKSGNVLFQTKEIDENPGFPDSMFGKVLYGDGEGAANALVIVTSNEDDDFPPVATLTNDNGGYSVSFKQLNKNYLLKVSLVTVSGYKSDRLVASYDNKPVYDIVLETQNDMSLNSANYAKKQSNSLISKAYADGNSCFESGALGGISVQCSESVHWFRGLNPNECPASSGGSFRVGLVEHTHYTHLFVPSEGKVSLYLNELDSSGKVVNSSQNIDNGQKINASVLKDKVSYELKARIVDGSGNTIKECQDIDRGGPIIIKKDTPKTTHGEKKIENLNKTVEVCPKFGENFAVIPGEVRTEDMIKATNRLGMNWGEVIAVDLEGVDHYRDIVERASVVNMRIILRLCYRDKCELTNGSTYGQKVVETYKKLVSSGKAKNGIYVHVGHNEVNVTEYRLPAQEAKFMNDAIEVIAASGNLAMQSDGPGIHLLGPNLDLFFEGGGKPEYKKANEYVDALLSSGLSLDNAKKIQYWTGNVYIKDGKNDYTAKVFDHIKYLRGKGLNGKFIVTETGKINGGSWEALGDNIGTLIKSDDVAGVLIFNSFGLNPGLSGDASSIDYFAYHKELWDDYKSDKLTLHNSILDRAGCTQRVKVEIIEPGAPIDIVLKGIGGPVGEAQEDPPTSDPIPVSSDGVLGVSTTKDVLGAATMRLPEIGEFLITSSKYKILRPYVSRFSKEDRDVSAFFDTNKNLIKDEGEEFLTSMAGFEYKKVGYVNKFDLAKGHNVISISLYPYDVLSAETLLNVINNQGGNATAIGYIENGSWKIFNRVNGVSYSKNFDIKSGMGLYIKSETDSTFTLRGDEYSQPVGVYLYKGWNLVGIHGSDKDYTFKSTLENIAKNELLEVESLAVWDEQSNKYKMFIYDGSSAYGDEDLPVTENTGVFVKTKVGGEYWKPE